ncbi:unnamed protein product, partial [Timema podura]|nr:unnamed protein product [Timema podura]
MADRYERKYVEKEKLTPLGCICKRDNRLIRCVCGYTIVGRLRRTCPVHLNDYDRGLEPSDMVIDNNNKDRPCESDGSVQIIKQMLENKNYKGPTAGRGKYLWRDNAEDENSESDMCIGNDKERPCLWNKKFKEYKNRILQEKNWVEICQFIDDTYENKTTEEKKKTDNWYDKAPSFGMLVLFYDELLLSEAIFKRAHAQRVSLPDNRQSSHARYRFETHIQRPCLWNKKFKEYKNRILQEKNWVEICQFIDDTYENKTTEEKKKTDNWYDKAPSFGMLVLFYDELLLSEAIFKRAHAQRVSLPDNRQSSHARYRCRAGDDQPITHYEDDEDEVFLGFDNTIETYAPPPDGSGEDGDISSTPDDTAPDID